MSTTRGAKHGFTPLEIFSVFSAALLCLCACIGVMVCLRRLAHQLSLGAKSTGAATTSNHSAENKKSTQSIDLESGIQEPVPPSDPNQAVEQKPPTNWRSRASSVISKWPFKKSSKQSKKERPEISRPTRLVPANGHPSIVRSPLTIQTAGSSNSDHRQSGLRRAHSLNNATLLPPRQTSSNPNQPPLQPFGSNVYLTSTRSSSLVIVTPVKNSAGRKVSWFDERQIRQEEESDSVVSDSHEADFCPSSPHSTWESRSSIDQLDESRDSLSPSVEIMSSDTIAEIWLRSQEQTSPT